METVLLYNIAGTPLAPKLKTILLQMKIRVRVVSPEQYREPIGLLAGLKDFSLSVPLSNSLPDPGHSGGSALSTGGTSDTDNFSEPMIVMSGFTGRRLDQFLLELRKKKLPPVPLKAVITAQNQYWDSLTLYRELLKEHQSMQKTPSET